MLAEPVAPSLAAQARRLGGSIVHISGSELLPADRHYNAGLLYLRDRLHLFYRKQVMPSQFSKIGYCTLGFDLKPVLGTGKEIKLPETLPDQQYEDPRVCMSIDRSTGEMSPWLSYTTTESGSESAPIALVKLNDDFDYVRELNLAWGQNGQYAVIQKNWTFFRYRDKMMCVYKPYPHEVFFVDTATGSQILVSQKTSSDEIVTWRYGEIRGGAPPIKVGESYFSFFHSRLPHPDPERKARYYMGVYEFWGEPPFRPKRCSKLPILVASEMEKAAHNLPYTVFPCGAQLVKDEWVISMGVNDNSIALLRLPHSKLLQHLSKE